RNHERLGDLAAKGAPSLREIGLFTVPPDFSFDPTEPWDLRLLVQRPTGAREKAFLTFDLPYSLPDRYIRREKIQAAPTKVAASGAAKIAAPSSSTASPEVTPGEEPFWKKMWQRSTGSIAITVIALALLTVIFFFQNALVRRPVFYTWV